MGKNNMSFISVLDRHKSDEDLSDFMSPVILAVNRLW